MQDDASTSSEVSQIIHMTESFASGTLGAMREMIYGQSALGYRISVAHMIRPDSPAEPVRDQLFPAGVTRTEIRGNKLSALWSLGKIARKSLRSDPGAVVHVHSSFAAAAVRLAMLGDAANRRVVYSPHGFAFLREDLPQIVRGSIRLAEKFLARNSGGLMLVSCSEAELAMSWVSGDKISVVENAVDLDSLPLCRDSGDKLDLTGRLPLVVTMGRITYQKAPWKFAELSRKLEDKAEFVWVGDGSKEDKDRWLIDAPISVTGWLDASEVTKRLQTASIFVLPSLWEGMPLALIEAQCLGLPAVASNIVGNKDVILDNESGLLADSDDEFTSKVLLLLEDAAVRESMARAAVGQRGRFDRGRLGPQTLNVYQRLIAAP